MIETAFFKYLLTLDLDEATDIVIKHLRPDSELKAWELVAEMRGDSWKCKPEELRDYIEETLVMAKLAHEEWDNKENYRKVKVFIDGKESWVKVKKKSKVREEKVSQ